MDVNPRSTARIGGRPIHAMLVSIPMVCFVVTFITDLVYWRTAIMMWADMSAWLLTVGLIVSVFLYPFKAPVLAACNGGGRLC